VNKKVNKRIAWNKGILRAKREIRTCAASSCNVTFECRANSTKKYCCRKCYYKTFSLEGAKEERSRKKRNALRDPVYRKQVIQAAHKGNASRWSKPGASQRQSAALIKAYKSGVRERKSGKDAPNWQGGISNLPYPFEFNEKLTESIRERDNHTCQFCGKTQEEEYRKLSVHHIDYDKDNLDWNNLITLCTSCNIKANFNREYWKEFFQLKLKDTSNGNSYTNISTM